MRCSLCGIDVSGRHSSCPLCGSPLSGTPIPSPFPPNSLGKTSRKAQMVLGAITLCLVIVSALLCTLLRAPIGIMVSVAVALTVNYLFVRNIILHSPSVFRSVVRYFLVIIALAYIWYAATGDQNAIDFIIPGISITSLVFDSMLIILLSRQFTGAYSKYILFNIAIGLIPLAFLAAHAVENPIPSAFNLAAAVGTGIILCLSMGGQLADELKRLLQH